MNSLAKATDFRSRRASAVTSLAVMSVLFLAGCADAGAEPKSPPTATTTGTSTPTAAAAVVPASADEAVTQATATLQAYTAMLNLIFNEGGANPERIDAYAGGVVRDQVVLDARQVAELGYQFDGGIVATVESGYAGELQADGEPIEFGSVHLIFCNDSTGRSVVQSDGSVPPLPADRAPRYDAGISFDPVTMSWSLQSLTSVGTSCI